MGFNLSKTISLSKYLLEKSGGEMQYLKLIKLLYFCDREMLISYDRTITEDSYVSMILGPVLSNTYNLIKETNNEWLRKHSQMNRSWSEVFKKEGYILSIKKGKHNTFLDISDDEKFIADAIVLIFKDDEAFEVAEYTHIYCTEWKDPQPLGVTSLPLSLEDIRAAIKNNQEAIAN